MIPQQKPVVQHRENLEGQTLKDGEYLVQRMLGQGGMSTVYLASHTTLSIPFAIKQMRADQPLPERVIAELDAFLQNNHIARHFPSDHATEETMPSSNGEHTDRFLREALFLARLQHPALPALYDYFSEDGDWYLVMDYIPGHTLAQQMHKRSPIPPLEALGYTMQLCEVLDYLHRQIPSIIFRDLKPSNVLLKSDGTVSLIDFGIARYVTDKSVNSNVDIGSPGYAAPEQCRNDEWNDTRCDLYSLGVMLYEMLTGQRTHVGEKLAVSQHTNPPISHALSGLVKLATQLNPDQRFQSEYTFYLALERAYKIEERRVYRRQALPQMGVYKAKDTLILPAVQEDEDTAPLPSVNVQKTSQIEAGLAGALSPVPLEQRRYIRKELHRARQKHLTQAHLDVELASVEESLKHRSLNSLNSLSQTAQQAIEEIHQPPAVPSPGITRRPSVVTQQHARPSATAQRVIQISFLIALIVFLVMTSLLAYIRVVPRSWSNTVPHATPTRIDSKRAEVSSWKALPSLPAPNADNTAVYIKEQGHASIYMSGGYLGSGTSSNPSFTYDRRLYNYDIEAASWKIASENFPGMVNNAAVVDERDHIFFTAGYSPDTHTVVSALYVYQPKNGSLQKISAPAQVELGFGGSMLADQQGHLYIMQGFMQGGNPHALAGTSWYRYDITTQLWHVLAPLPVGLGYTALTTSGKEGILLLSGAIDAGQQTPTNKIYRYNIALNSWTQEVSSLPQSLSGTSACQVWPGQMAFIGGYDAAHRTGLNSSWLLDLHTFRWQKLPSLPAGGSLLGTATCDGNGHLFLTRGASDLTKPTRDFWMLTVPQEQLAS